MKIQTNYAYLNPVFRAGLCQRGITQDLITGAAKESSDGEAYTYALLANLNNMKSNDELEITYTQTKPAHNQDKRVYKITNITTGASVCFNEVVDKTTYVDTIYDDQRTFETNDLAEGFYNTIMNPKNLKHLFEDTTLKPGTEFILPKLDAPMRMGEIEILTKPLFSPRIPVNVQTAILDELRNIISNHFYSSSIKEYAFATIEKVANEPYLSQGVKKHAADLLKNKFM